MLMVLVQFNEPNRVFNAQRLFLSFGKLLIGQCWPFTVSVVTLSTTNNRVRSKKIFIAFIKCPPKIVFKSPLKFSRIFLRTALVCLYQATVLALVIKNNFLFSQRILRNYVFIPERKVFVVTQLNI